MRIKFTLNEILENGDWDKFCEVTGTNPWCLNEGLAIGDEEYELTVDECKLFNLD